LRSATPPTRSKAYAKQQLRWATGGFEILFTSNPLFTRRKLTLDQRLMYFVTATHYLTGIAPGLLLLVPVLEIFFDLRPVSLNVGIGEWMLAYAGFYGLQIVLAFFTLGSFRIEVLMLAASSFPIYMKAFMNVVIGRDTAWSVTGASKRAASPFNFLTLQVVTFVILAGHDSRRHLARRAELADRDRDDVGRTQHGRPGIVPRGRDGRGTQASPRRQGGSRD
jgi:cellulose synthase (UDP-forming)